MKRNSTGSYAWRYGLGQQHSHAGRMCETSKGGPSLVRLCHKAQPASIIGFHQQWVSEVLRPLISWSSCRCQQAGDAVVVSCRNVLGSGRGAGLLHILSYDVWSLGLPTVLARVYQTQTKHCPNSTRTPCTCVEIVQHQHAWGAPRSWAAVVETKPLLSRP